MPPFTLPRSRAVRLGLALVALAGFVALVGAGCTTNPEPSASARKCAFDQRYDSRTASCVRPTSPEEARELATRTDLEDLRDGGDYITLVQIVFRTPGDRTEFESLLSSVSPDSVSDIHYLFPQIGGGFAVPAHVDGVTPSTAELLAKSKMLISARFAGLTNSDLSAMSVQFSDAFLLAQERYLEVDLRARPSLLLAAWEHDSNIAYISIITAPVLQ